MRWVQAPCQVSPTFSNMNRVTRVAVVVGQDHLAGEMRAGGDLHRLAGGAVHLHVRDLDGGPGAVLVVGIEVGAVVGERVLALGEGGVPDEAARVAVELALLDMIEGRGGLPVALVVAGPEFALRVLIDAVGHAEAGGPGGEFALGIAVEDPAFPFHGGVVAAAAAGVGEGAEGVLEGGAGEGGGADGDEVAALAIAGQRVGLVVVSAEAPAVGEAGEAVGLAVAVACPRLRSSPPSG